jgi:hypothetical protein
MKRSGTADLPLHSGRVPPWLAKRMTELGTAIAEHIVLEYGASEFLTRLSDPFWKSHSPPHSPRQRLPSNGPYQILLRREISRVSVRRSRGSRDRVLLFITTGQRRIFMVTINADKLPAREGYINDDHASNESDSIGSL